MPTCWICLNEFCEEEFAGGRAHDCQETALGEPGPEIPSSDADSPSAFESGSPLPRRPRLRQLLESLLAASSIHRAAPFELERPEEYRPNTSPSPSSSSRSPALDTIRRGTIRRIQTITRTVEQSENPDHRSSTKSLPPLSTPTYQRHRRHISWIKSNSRQSLPPIPEEESEPSPEGTPTRSSTRPLPIPPLTSERQLLLIQDYTDREEDFSTIIDRLDDAIASSPELWTPVASEAIHGQPVPPNQFYRRLHEFHQQRIANRAPSSIPYFFPRLGAKQYEW